MTTFSSFARIALVVLTSAPLTAGGAQPPAAGAVTVETLGPQVGARVPDFTLNDQHGQSRALSSLLGPKGAVLVFFRSADW